MNSSILLAANSPVGQVPTGGSLGLGNFFLNFPSYGPVNLSGPAAIDSIIFLSLTLAMSVIGLICMIFLIIAGFQYMTSNGDQNEVAKSRKTITASVIGLIIVISAFFITVVVFRLFNVPQCFGFGGAGFGNIYNSGYNLTTCRL